MANTAKKSAQGWWAHRCCLVAAARLRAAATTREQKRELTQLRKNDALYALKLIVFALILSQGHLFVFKSVVEPQYRFRRA